MIKRDILLLENPTLAPLLQGDKISELRNIFMSPPHPFISMSNKHPYEAWIKHGPLTLERILEMNELPKPEVF